MPDLAPTPRIEQFIKSYETCRLVAFKPTPNDVWTIGWGHTDHVFAGLKWTQALADTTFDIDCKQRSAAVSHLLKVATSQNEFDALLSLTYNIGVGGLATSHLLAYHNAGRKDLVALEFPKWVHQGSTILNGLIERRAREAAIYAKGVYRDHNA